MVTSSHNNTTHNSPPPFVTLNSSLLPQIYHNCFEKTDSLSQDFPHLAYRKPMGEGQFKRNLEMLLVCVPSLPHVGPPEDIPGQAQHYFEHSSPRCSVVGTAFTHLTRL
jgi:hypothetical protein